MKKVNVLHGLIILGLAGVMTACASQPSTSAKTYELPDDAFAVAMNPQRDYLIMVNDDHPYDFNGEYDRLLQDDLIWVSDIYGEATLVEKGTYLAFNQLQAAMQEKGLEVGLYSAYRTKEDQQLVFENYGNLEGWSETNKVTKPGYSEHHTGLLLNVVILYPSEDGEEIWYTETAKRQAEIPEFRILHETLADYGFIDRYPAGKEDITNTPSKPYEIRFVGSSEIAHEIMDNGLCLEEYVASHSK